MKLIKNNTCSEDIKKMKKDGSQRFCSSCRKNVVDFRNKTADEIIQYIEENGKPCMILFEDQVNEINAMDQTAFNKFSVLGKAAAVAGMISVSAFASAQKTPVNMNENELTQQKETKNSLEVFVTDKDGKPLKEKNIILKTSGKEFKHITDENGKSVFYFHEETDLTLYTITMEETGETKSYSVASETGNKSEKSVKFVSGEVNIPEPEKYSVNGKVINTGGVEINMKDITVVIEVMENGVMKTVKEKRVKKNGEFQVEIPAELFKQGKVYISTSSSLGMIEHDGTSLQKSELIQTDYKVELSIRRNNRRMMVGFM